jgi:hypothetical protein
MLQHSNQISSLKGSVISETVSVSPGEVRRVLNYLGEEIGNLSIAASALTSRLDGVTRQEPTAQANNAPMPPLNCGLAQELASLLHSVSRIKDQLNLQAELLEL